MFLPAARVTGAARARPEQAAPVLPSGTAARRGATFPSIHPTHRLEVQQCVYNVPDRGYGRP
ncbi:hypothetical protein GCM10011576_24620 [Micromonospora parathelypteridis]|nr:hypothetical protein GCM10011576_24620 [Micromonospora parathelypteridis]